MHIRIRYGVINITHNDSSSWLPGKYINLRREFLPIQVCPRFHRLSPWWYSADRYCVTEPVGSGRAEFPSTCVEADFHAM
jgi:hypothetical protein